MKILIVTKTRTGGGTEKHIAQLVLGLRRRGLTVEVAYTEDGFWRLYNRIYASGYDVLHFFLPRPYVLGSLAAEMAAFNGTRIMSRRSLTASYQKQWIRWLEKLCHFRTDILIGNSPAVVSQLCDEAPAGKVQLIRNGVAIVPVPHNPSPTFRMLCVANIFPYKGHDDLLAAIEGIRDKLPKSWMLTLAGHGTEKFDWPWPDPHIAGAGYCDHVDHLYANADLFILPSHEEGASNALLEAMMCGVAVIATDVGGNKDMIEHGVNGLLVPPRSPDALGAAIMVMALDPVGRSEMATAGRKTALARFSFRRCLDEYQALYCHTVKGSGRLHQARA